MSLEEFSQRNIDALSERSEGFELRASEVTTLAGNPAHTVAYGTGQGYGSLHTWTIIGNTAYEVFFMSTEANMGNLAPLIDVMSSSFSVSQAGGNSDGNSFGLSNDDIVGPEG
jgi:hypothetical protein